MTTATPITDSLSDTVWAGLRNIANACYQNSRDKGWWKKYDALRRDHPDLYKAFLPEILSSKLMLMVSEDAEALEEIRENDGGLYFSYINSLGKSIKGSRSVVRAEMLQDGRDDKLPKPEGFGVELADAVIRHFDLAVREGIDLSALIKLKMEYNEGRAFMHGGKVI